MVTEEVSKSSLRRNLTGLRHSMVAREVREKSELIQKMLLELPEYKDASRLALYSSFNNEVLTDTVFADALECGRKVYFPRADSERTELAFVRVKDREELHPGLFSINEPHSGCIDELKADELDLIVVPGVVFDTAFARVGYGKGFYDRALKGAKGLIVAFAYEFQVMEGARLPVLSHDIGVDVIITEKRLIRNDEAGSAGQG